ncbi:MAG: hypothetical protein R3F56_16505 [Planctomycetota bacterium]
MADAAEVHTARRRMGLPWNLRLARGIRRLTLPLALVGGVVLQRGYGVRTVPIGMDTLPDTHPPGTRCLVDKRPSHVVVGAVVFAEVPGGTVLGRVESRFGDDRLQLAADNDASCFADLLRAPVPLRAVRGLVLVTFLPEPEVPRGR